MRRSPIPQQLEFKPLATWQQLGLGGILDCKGNYFIINLATGLFSLSFLFLFIILLNFDGSFNQATWDGFFNDTLACEDFSEIEDIIEAVIVSAEEEGANLTDQSAESLEIPFVFQKINAGSCYTYVLAGLFCALLGFYDRSSWKERDMLWRETHYKSAKDAGRIRGNTGNSLPRANRAGAVQQTTGTAQRPGSGTGLPSQTTRRSLGRMSTGRSVSSKGTSRTKGTTYSIEHEEITLRRRYHEYILGRRGSPSLIVRQPIWSMVFAASLIFLGFTGFLFHASLTSLAKLLDDFALWVLIINLIAYAWARYFVDGVKWNLFCIDCSKIQENPRRSSFCLTMLFLGLGAGLDFVLYVSLDVITNRDFIRAFLIAALVVFSIPMFLHYYSKKQNIGSAWTLLIISMFLLLAGYLFNEFDVPGETLCFETSGFQSHALWHVISATGAIFVYLFFRSDFYLKDVPLDEENSPRLLTNLEELPNFVPTGNFRATSRQTGLRAGNPMTASETQLTGSPGSGSLNGRASQYTSLSEGGSTGAQATGTKRASRKSSKRTLDRRSRQRATPVRTKITLDRNNNAAVYADDANSNGQHISEVEIEKMWTCVNCGYSENSMTNESTCKRCNQERPAMENMVAIPYSSTQPLGGNIRPRSRASPSERTPLKGPSTSLFSISNVSQVSGKSGRSRKRPNISAAAAAATKRPVSNGRHITRVNNRSQLSNSRLTAQTSGTNNRVSNSRVVNVGTGKRPRRISNARAPSNARIRTVRSNGSHSTASAGRRVRTNSRSRTNPRKSIPRSAEANKVANRKASRDPPMKKQSSKSDDDDGPNI